MLAWRDGMILDKGGLDTDHRLQHELIRRFVAMPGEEEQRDQALAILRDLRAASARHFLREEQVQTAIRYPHLEEHRSQHRRLMEVLEEIVDLVEARESIFTFPYVKSKADELLQYWFFDHFAKADLRLKTHLAKCATR